MAILPLLNDRYPAYLKKARSPIFKITPTAVIAFAPVRLEIAHPSNPLIRIPAANMKKSRHPKQA